MINTNLQKMTNSSTMSTNEQVKTLRKQGKDIIALGFGQSPFPPPPGLVSQLQQHAHTNEYLPVQGLLPLRQEIADYYSKRDGRPLGPEDVVIGPGTKQLQFLLQLAMRQPHTFVPVPCWVSYSAHCKIINRKIRPLYTRLLDNWKMQESKLDTIRNTKGLRLFIFANPNNPTGTIYTPEELATVANKLDDPNIVLLLDEIYSELTFQPPFVSLAKYSPAQSIISSGISKSMGAGGWRLGYLVFPPELAELRKTVVTLASETHSCATTPIQYACRNLFTNPEFQEYHRKSRKILSALTDYGTGLFKDTYIRVVKPMATWYLFLDFLVLTHLLNNINIHNAEELCNTLLEKLHISSTPGNKFLQQRGEIGVRLCLVDFDGDAALQHCPLETHITEQWLEMYTPRPVQGLRRIRDWINCLPNE